MAIKRTHVEINMLFIFELHTKKIRMPVAEAAKASASASASETATASESERAA